MREKIELVGTWFSKPLMRFHLPASCKVSATTVFDTVSSSLKKFNMRLFTSYCFRLTEEIVPFIPHGQISQICMQQHVVPTQNDLFWLHHFLWVRDVVYYTHTHLHRVIKDQRRWKEKKEQVSAKKTLRGNRGSCRQPTRWGREADSGIMAQESVSGTT